MTNIDEFIKKDKLENIFKDNPNAAQYKIFMKEHSTLFAQFMLNNNSVSNELAKTIYRWPRFIERRTFIVSYYTFTQLKNSALFVVSTDLFQRLVLEDPKTVILIDIKAGVPFFDLNFTNTQSNKFLIAGPNSDSTGSFSSFIRASPNHIKRALKKIDPYVYNNYLIVGRPNNDTNKDELNYNYLTAVCYKTVYTFS